MKRILVIEDNKNVRENIAEILSISNYEVIAAENGLVGVEKALTENPDLIICDVMMPELDGFGVLHILSKKPQTSDIPFIFLTAKTETTDFRTGMNLGADDYLTKPFHHIDLLDAVQLRLIKSERLRKIFSLGVMDNKTLIDEVRGQYEFKKLAAAKEMRRYHKKDLIFQEGDLPKRLYFVAKGKVKTYRTNEYGKEFITGIYGPGQFLGHQALIQNKPYEASAAVMKEAEINLIPKNDFIELLYSSRDFSACFIKILANNVEEKEEQLLNLAYNSIRKRVADALLDIDERHSKIENQRIDILRDDLASMVGTAKESISRMLTDFKTEKMISIDKSGVITILDKEKLAHLPN